MPGTRLQENGRTRQRWAMRAEGTNELDQEPVFTFMLIHRGEAWMSRREFEGVGYRQSGWRWSHAEQVRP